MKTMDEISQVLNQQVPLDPLVKVLNDTFGPLGWEYDSMGDLKVMAKVSDGHFLSVTRYGKTLAAAAEMFGLGETSGKAKTSNLEQANGPARAVGPQQGQLEGVRGESHPTVPARASGPSRKVINDSISEASQVILAKKLRTQAELIAMVQAYQVKRKEELNDEQAMKLLEQLKGVLQ